MLPAEFQLLRDPFIRPAQSVIVPDDVMDGIAGVIGMTIDELIGIGTNMADLFDETEVGEEAR